MADDLFPKSRKELHPSERWKGKLKAEIPLGSMEHAYQQASLLELRWQRKEMGDQEFEESLVEIGKYQLYKVWPDGNPVGSIDGFIKKITGKSIRETQVEIAQWQAATISQGTRTDTSCESHDVIGNNRGSGQKEYTLRRLARDHPAIFAAYERGDYPSVRQAAIAAGIVKVPTVRDQLIKLWAKASEEDRVWFRTTIAYNGYSQEGAG